MSKDAALRALRGAIEGAPHGAAALIGPSGAPRAAVLQALVDELGARLPVAAMRRPTLPLGGLWMELAARFDLDGGYDAKRRILRLAAELAGQGRGILVVVDGADALPGESLYGLLDVARSERGFHVLLGWPDDGAAQPLPENLFTATIESASPAAAAAWVPASAPVVEAPRPRIVEPSSGRFADVMPTARAMDPEPSAKPPAVVPSFAERPPMLEPEELPVHVRRARRGGLERTAWVASGLAVGLVLGVLLESSGWLGQRGAAEPEAAADAAATPDVSGAPADPVYLPASEPPKAFAPVAARKPAAEREPQPAPPANPPVAAAPLPETAPALRPEDLDPAPGPASAPRPAEVARPVPAEPRDAAAAPPPTPDVSAPPPSNPSEASPAEAPDLAAPQPAAPPPAPAPVAPPHDVARRSPFDARAPYAEGRLSVRSESPVMVEVDGRPLGPAPLVGVALPRGEHRVIAKYADGTVALKTIFLAAEDVAVSFR